MKTIFKKIFLLIFLILSFGTNVHAINTDNAYNTILNKYEYKGDQTQQPTTLEKENNTSITECKEINSKVEVTKTLIQNNLEYVRIIAYLYVVSLIAIIILVIINREKCQAKDIVTILGLVSVIFGTLLLTLIVDTAETLTAPMGILGAIAGYLFGTAQKKENPDGRSKKQQGES